VINVLNSVRPRAPSVEIGLEDELVTAATKNLRGTWCPVCEQPATLVEGRDTGGWCRVDGCRCGGFFVAADTVEWRLPRLSTEERAELSVTIQGFGAMGREAWLSTSDGRISGRLVVRVKRPSDAS
jgi:hypothetical protein